MATCNFGVTIPATIPQGSEIPEGLMNNPVYQENECNKCSYIYFVILAGPGRYNEFSVEDQAGTFHRLQWTNLR
jgi:hypothetical protein